MNDVQDSRHQKPTWVPGKPGLGVSDRGRPRRALAALAIAFAATGCTPFVRYTEELVDADYGRTPFTRYPAAVGGTVGFAVGIPIDVAAFIPAWIVYRSQPRETRDAVSIFLFPSFVAWRVGLLFGAPFDLVEWCTWRAWQAPRELTAAERDAVEREWDLRGNYPEYPVTPIYPPPPPPAPPKPAPAPAPGGRTGD
ncbi:MAG: hypothetical protein WAT39_15360 [Planctomycetota bacterium]